MGLIVSFDPRVFEVKNQRFKVFIFRFFSQHFWFESHWFAKSFEFVEIHADMSDIWCASNLSEDELRKDSMLSWENHFCAALAQAKQETPIWFEEMVRHAVDAVMQCIADYFECSKVVRLRGVQVKT